jgi:hypothetical protein
MVRQRPTSNFRYVRKEYLWSPDPLKSRSQFTYCKVRSSHYRPGQVLRAPEGWGSQLSALCTGRLYTQDMPLVLISVKGWVASGAIVWPQGWSQWKIEPATFRLVAQCLNQRRHVLCLKILRSAHSVKFFSFVWTYETNSDFFPYTAVTDWCLKPRWRVFTARYELNIDTEFKLALFLNGLN